MNKKAIHALVQEVEKESYAQKMNLKLRELKPGYAMVEMEPQPDILNIFGMTHGGAIFSLIDEAFQLSCNSHGQVAVALNVNVTYHKSPDISSRLKAISRETHLSKKTATYEIKVYDQGETLIASCMALAYRKKEKLPFINDQ
jgi:acyl-CoA thioesterase